MRDLRTVPVRTRSTGSNTGILALCFIVVVCLGESSAALSDDRGDRRPGLAKEGDAETGRCCYPFLYVNDGYVYMRTSVPREVFLSACSSCQS